MMLKKYFQWLPKNNHLILIFIGALTWTLVVVRNGLSGEDGMNFWGANAHDGLWHVSLANGFLKGSFGMPMFSGEYIKNYHIGFDLLLAALSKITFIPVINLYFQILPPVFALLTGIFAYKFTLKLTKSRSSAFWATFFVYFGGSWGWFLSLVRGQGMAGESMFWSMQSVSTLINPPFAMSIILIFAGLYYLLVGMEDQNTKYFTIATFLFGLLAITKVYASILILVGLFVVAIYWLVKTLKPHILKVFIGVTILTFLILIGQRTDYNGTFIFRPFWFLETMMSGTDRLNWSQFASAMMNYKIAGNWFFAGIAYITALCIFVIGNLGTRLIGIFYLMPKAKKIEKIKYIDLILILIILFGFSITTFFVQRGIEWNTIQFVYYSLFLSSIYSGRVVGYLVEKLQNNVLVRYLIITLVVLLTVPTTIGTLRFYLSVKPSAVISKHELDALQFLKGEPEGVVLTQPFPRDVDTDINKNISPLYLYESTAYVSALSQKNVYLEDEVNLIITGFMWKQRRAEVQKYFLDADKDFLSGNNIKYVYILKDLDLFNNESVGLYKIFENDEVIIYRDE